MKFSLCVPTVGRPELIRRLFRSLTEQTFQDFEVIVADQSGGEEVAAACGEFARRFPLRRIAMDVRGVSRAKNVGLAEAAGEIVTFPDDDCWYPPDLLERVLAKFETDASLGGLSTASVDPETGGTVTKFEADAADLTPTNLLTRLIDFGLFFRTNTVAGLRYDEAMGVGSGTPYGADEGPDFVIGVLASGARVRYEPDLVIYHPAPTRVWRRELPRRQYSYCTGRGRLWRKHGYPAGHVLNSIGRTALGVPYMLATLRPRWAYYYLAGVGGKVRGYLAPGLASR